MARYCIVVKSDNDGLFEALQEAFLGRGDYRVIRDRRAGAPAGAWPHDRRRARVWETRELLFAESEDE